MKTFKRLLTAGIVLAVMTVSGWFARLAFADGIPAANALTYSGMLEDAAGAPVTGSKNIQVQFWNAASGGTTPLCLTQSQSIALVGGRFQSQLPDTCAAAVKANADLWVEVLVEGLSLGRTKLGAVPYAVAAGTASTAAGALDARLNALMPPKTVVSAFLTPLEVATSFDATGLGKSNTAYAGWAICNGSNGTPNLAGKFVRGNTTAAGATGGTDNSAHTHPIGHDHAAFTSGGESGHTHSTPDHHHLMPIGWGAGWEYWASDAGGSPLYGSMVITANRYTPALPTSSYQTANLAYTDTSGGGTTGAGANHTHSVDPPAFAGTSGDASSADNRPAFYELVPLMRL
jgi:hypothetical protein